MGYTDFFNDPASGYNPCHELSAGNRKIALDLFLDQQAFERRWRRVAKIAVVNARFSRAIAQVTLESHARGFRLAVN
jgi:hypothetical protein